MYNRKFKADYLLTEAGCPGETVAFLEIALKYFEVARLPESEDRIKKEREFKVEEIFDEVFSKDSDGRYTEIKFPKKYKENAGLIEKLEKMFQISIKGKTFDELLLTHKPLECNITETTDMFDIIVKGIEIVFTRQPYVFRSYFYRKNGVPYVVVGSWANPKVWGNS